MKLRHDTRFGKILLSAIAVSAVGGLGVLTTGATFTDQVTMAQVSVTGGSLDLKANGGDGPNQAWTGSLAAAVTGMKPGDEQSGTVSISNAGNLPFTITSSTTGTDASGCYGFYFRETAVTAGTGNTVFPNNVTGMGTAIGADGTVAPLATSVATSTLLDVTAGTDAIWEAGDAKTYTLTVRMKSTCTTNAAPGTLNVSLNATQ